jgi:hypothetical protein
LTLNRLLPHQVAQMARTMVGADALFADLLDQIVAQTDEVAMVHPELVAHHSACLSISRMPRSTWRPTWH